MTTSDAAGRERSPSPTFNLMTAGDLRAVLALIDEGSRPGASALAAVEGARSALADILDDPNNSVVVGRLGDRIVACAQMTIIPGLTHGGARRAHVEVVRVAADLRGRGLGSLLMAEVARRAAEAGCRTIQLMTHNGRTDAHRFYEALGYEPTHVGMKRTQR